MEEKEIQEWRDRLIKMFGIYHSDGQEYVTCPLCGINLDELANYMIRELDRAREEGMFDRFELGYIKTLHSEARVYRKHMGFALTEEREKRDKDFISKLSKLTTK